MFIVSAEEKNKLGVGKILEELNSMVLKIARDEGRLDIFSGLSSIFPLIQEQLPELEIPEFLPALWQGSMNPPESRYGEIVQQMKAFNLSSNVIKWFLGCPMQYLKTCFTYTLQTTTHQQLDVDKKVQNRPTLVDSATKRKV